MVVLEQMSEVLKLECAVVSGFLIGNKPFQQWYFEPAIGVEITDLQDQGSKTGNALGKYLVVGGVCPLLDEEAHPQALYQ